jgi:hypothetical protein
VNTHRSRAACAASRWRLRFLTDPLSHPRALKSNRKKINMPFAESTEPAGARSSRGLESVGRLLKMNRAGPAGRRTESQDYSQPGIFDVVADLFSVPGPIAVAGLSTGQSGRLGAPPWRPPQGAGPKPRGPGRYRLSRLAGAVRRWRFPFLHDRCRRFTGARRRRGAEWLWPRPSRLASGLRGAER